MSQETVVGAKKRKEIRPSMHTISRDAETTIPEGPAIIRTRSFSPTSNHYYTTRVPPTRSAALNTREDRQMQSRAWCIQLSLSTKRPYTKRYHEALAPTVWVGGTPHSKEWQYRTLRPPSTEKPHHPFSQERGFFDPPREDLWKNIRELQKAGFFNSLHGVCLQKHAASLGSRVSTTLRAHYSVDYSL